MPGLWPYATVSGGEGGGGPTSTNCLAMVGVAALLRDFCNLFVGNFVLGTSMLGRAACSQELTNQPLGQPPRTTNAMVFGAVRAQRNPGGAGKFGWM